MKFYLVAARTTRSFGEQGFSNSIDLTLSTSFKQSDRVQMQELQFVLPELVGLLNAQKAEVTFETLRTVEVLANQAIPPNEPEDHCDILAVAMELVDAYCKKHPNYATAPGHILVDDYNIEESSFKVIAEELRDDMETPVNVMEDLFELMDAIRMIPGWKEKYGDEQTQRPEKG